MNNYSQIRKDFQIPDTFTSALGSITLKRQCAERTINKTLKKRALRGIGRLILKKGRKGGKGVSEQKVLLHS